MIIYTSPLDCSHFKTIIVLPVLRIILDTNWPHPCFFVANLQYLSHIIRPGKNIFDRFAVLFSVVIVWFYAYILTVSGAYKNKPPTTQTSCRTDRAGLISGAPW